VNQTADAPDLIAAQLAADLDAGFAALAASGCAAAACSFLSARSRPAGRVTPPAEDRSPARLVR